MKGKIGNLEAVLLIFSTIFPTAILALPVIIGKYTEQDSLIALLLSGVAGMGIAWLVGTVVKISNGRPFLEWVSREISPVFATVIGILLLQYYLDLMASILRQYINFIKDNVLLYTPTVVMAVVAMLVILYMTGRGIKPISQINSMVSLLLLLILPLYIAGLSKNINLHRLLPLLDHSAAALTLASLSPVGWMSEVAILFFIAPYLKSPNKAASIGVAGVGLVAVIVSLDLLMTLVVLGPQALKNITYPIFATIGTIQLGRYLENADILFISYWIMCVYLKLAIITFAALQCLKQTFRIQNDEPYAAALLLVALTECLYTWENPKKFSLYNEQGRILTFVLLNVLLPLGVLLWMRIKRPDAQRKEYKT
ncbi:spore germination protein KB [Paenibacillus forsythiae]|uniref:Spore germination protein KB n=1 Tax=Paenibacillus forsythiae TaxID=365616 RepID=A0ABU3HCU3_9BACL|nr:endospore germination permease [Paenibacillus forsythiae]MDT3428635.1 spore germination protein KB [Paenibacillus forsythiae]